MPKSEYLLNNCGNKMGLNISNRIIDISMEVNIIP
jgi:hypothetical protein